MKKCFLWGRCRLLMGLLLLASCGGGDTTDLIPDWGADPGVPPADAAGDVAVVPDTTFELSGDLPGDVGEEDWKTLPDAPGELPEEDVWDLWLPDLGDVAQPDIGEGFCLEDGGFGCPCSNNIDCSSGWCVQTPEGQLCSMTCVEECPEGWVCTLIQDPPDTVGVCMPTHPTLCNPCATNQECQGSVVGLKVLCVDRGATGAFCGGDCSDDGAPCPDGYTCENVPSVNGAEGLQCVPAGGECACSELAVELGLKTGCFEENEHGSCAGERVCSEDGLSACSAVAPGPEICNSLDDNCDGVADNNLVQEECEVSNDWGSCPGIVLCVGGAPICQGKEPSGEACDGLDNNCDGTTDETYSDCDQDGIADCIESDDDADGWPDSTDNCPCAQNPIQEDQDSDGSGDACDPDDDNDGVPDEEDCAPTDPSVFPGVAEACNGADDDCDELVDEGFLDTDQNGEADCVDLDDDGDGFPDVLDNCPSHENVGQEDHDFDTQGDSCDLDDDGDGYPDDNDCDPLDKMVYLGAPELCDCKDNDCDGIADDGFMDTDGDGVADCCEDDTDGDGVPNGIDNCPFTPNNDQLNTDGDIQGDECDADDDGDGVIDELDCAPKVKKAYPNAPEICDGIDNDCDGVVDNGYPDQDADGLSDCVDPDDDGDTIPDVVDICPFMPDPLQLDTDGDGLGDECDGDDDGDGDFDIMDCEPLDPGIHHGAAEICNGTDDNCDGEIDEAGAAGCVPLYPDEDADGFGADDGEQCMCNLVPPYVSFNGGDCDDDNEAVNPLVAELCNGFDDNCDEIIDPEDTTGCQAFYLDEDGDGFGVEDDAKCLCAPEEPYGTQEVGDCFPDDPEAYPGGPEVCGDMVDNNCNGMKEEGCVPAGTVLAPIAGGGTFEGNDLNMSFGAGLVPVSAPLIGDEMTMEMGVLPASAP